MKSKEALMGERVLRLAQGLLLPKYDMKKRGNFSKGG